MVTDLMQTAQAAAASAEQVGQIAEGRVNGRTYIDTNQTARSFRTINPSERTLVPLNKIFDRARDSNIVNANMRTAHAEIGVIQQASKEGVTRGADMIINVSGRRVCGFCRSDIPFADHNAGLKSLTVIEEVTGKQFYWNPSRGIRHLRPKN